MFLLPMIVAAVAAPRDTDDLALAYQRLEQAVARMGPEDPRCERVNQLADGAAASFLSGRLGDVVAQLDDAACAAGLDRELLGLSAEVNLDRLKVVGAAPHQWPAIEVRDDRGHARCGAWAARIEIAAQVIVDMPLDLPGGRYTVYAWFRPEDEAVALSSFVHGRRELALPIADLSLRLGSLAVLPSMAEPLNVLKDRLALVQGSHRSSAAARWVLDPFPMLAAIEKEVEALENGRDPYRHLTGDLWLTLPGPNGRIPCRLLVPSCSHDGAALPMIVALHGAGGNEHMMLDGHGAGALKRLAEQLGVVVLSPATPYLVTSEAVTHLFKALVDRIPIDPNRVYVLGHSLGAVAALRQLTGSGRVAGAVAIAGGGALPERQTTAPVRFYGAEIDAIIPARTIRAAAQMSKRNGWPAEYREVPDTGHVLIVSAVLDESVRWLLTLRRHSAPEP